MEYSLQKLWNEFYASEAYKNGHCKTCKYCLINEKMCIAECVKPILGIDKKRESEVESIDGKNL